MQGQGSRTTPNRPYSSTRVYIPGYPLSSRDWQPCFHTTEKSSTYRKNVGGNAPSPHALADDTLATLTYVRLSSITDVLRHYVLTVKTRTYVHACKYYDLKSSNFSSARSARFCTQEPGLGPRTPDAGGSWP